MNIPNRVTKQIGIAPGAELINLKVLDNWDYGRTTHGFGRTSGVLAALNWCIQNQAKYKIRVIDLSLGHSVYESYKTEPLCQAAEDCVRSGMVVVVSAGNLGKAEDGTVYGGITSPGNLPAAITAGAANTKGADQRSDDTVASYSSRGPTAIDGIIRPAPREPGYIHTIDSTT